MKTAKTKKAASLKYLPEGIIHHILSYLNTKEKACAGLLSKEWLKAWLSYPILEFYDLNSSGLNHETLESYRAYIYKTLERYQEGHIQLLSLNMRYYSDHNAIAFLNQFLKIAGKKGPQEMQLMIHGCGRFMPLLPERIVAAKSLTTLALSCVDIDDKTFGSLILSCRKIKNLTIDECAGLKTIKLINLNSLKELCIRNMSSIGGILEVNAPNLESMYLHWQHYTVSIKLLGSKNLRKLSLIRTYITDEFLDDFTNKFPCLEFFCFFLCHGFKKFDFTSHTLKEIHIFLLNPAKTKIDVPNASEIVCDLKTLLYQLSFAGVFNSCQSLSDITIRCVGAFVADDALWFIKLSELISNLRPSKISISIFHFRAVYENIQEIPICNAMASIEELIFNEFPSSGSGHSVFLDGLLWACRPKTIVVLKSCIKQDSLMELLYDKLIAQRRNQEFTNSASTSSSSTDVWKHDLKKVDFATYDDECIEEHCHKTHNQSWMHYMNRNQPLDLEFKPLVQYTSYVPKFVFKLKWNSRNDSSLSWQCW